MNQDFDGKARVKKMEEAILNEARDKVQVIRENADQQHKIDKNKIINLEKDKITDEYKRRLEAFQVEQKIKRSAKINEQRLSKMNARFELISKMKAEISHRVSTDLNNSDKYKQLLKQLIVQAMIKMNEPKLLLTCKQADTKLIESILPECEKQYTTILKQETNRDLSCKITIDKKHYLEEENVNTIGGVNLSCNEGKIKCINTLNARIELIFENMLPEIRANLFPSYQQGQI